ncbi:MAG TPA: 2-amino-4-hydroxy-6-hydroxymethyldihydropteridine diphosphokinase [Myxococcales bacterium]|jgi:2-amino-4-hydroxy-6-hydroxymethyldihydropteridine diphosphokinase
MRVYLGLGSNLGDRERNLAQAVRLLSRTPGVNVVARSSLWKSAPVGPPQPDYLNAAIEVDTTLGANALLTACKAIERELGREPGGQRWGPRTVDIDLLFADAIVAEPHLQVPHLELHKRAFALLPLCELAPEDAVHPVLRQPLKVLLAAVGDQVVERAGEFYVEL